MGATHRSGDSCSPLRRGDPMPPRGPAHNGQQHYGDGHRPPRSHPLSPSSAGAVQGVFVRHYCSCNVGTRARWAFVQPESPRNASVQRWCPCNCGSHASLQCMQHRCPCSAGAHATLLPGSAGVRADTGTLTLLPPVQCCCPCKAGTHAALPPTQCWCPCNTGTVQYQCPCNAAAHARHPCSIPMQHHYPCNVSTHATQRPCDGSTGSIATCSPDPAQVQPHMRCPSMQRCPLCPPPPPHPSVPLTAHRPQGCPGALGVLVALGVQAPA